jgi:PAS domain S-box-containing protein
MRITLVNQALIDVWGKGVEVIGKRFAEVMPELDNQNIYEQMVGVYSSGVPFHAKNQHVDLVVDGKLQPFYFNYSFIPLFDASGNVYGVMSTAGDVTDLIRAKQKIEDSERNLRNMILQAPVAMCIFSGPRFVIEIANHHMFEFWGRPAHELLHKPVFEALPEARDQGYEEMMTGVLQTGVAFSAKELTVTLPRQGGTQTVIINVAYEPIRETDDSISGIIAMVLDVTEQVQARKKIEESEQELQKRVAERTAQQHPGKLVQRHLGNRNDPQRTGRRDRCHYPAGQRCGRALCRHPKGGLFIQKGYRA